MDIYDRICRNLVQRYLSKWDIKDEYEEYEDFLGYILRLLAYLMHRVGFNLYGDKEDEDRQHLYFRQQIYDTGYLYELKDHEREIILADLTHDGDALQYFFFFYY